MNDSIINSIEYQTLQKKHKLALRYIRQKTNQLLEVMGTKPLLPDEIDDETVIELDPIGIISVSFAQILQNLKKINENLQNSYEEISIILNSIPAGVVLIDAQTYDIVYANPVCVEIIGLPKDDIIGQRCCMFFCTDGNYECPVMIKNHDIEKVESSILTANGEIRTILKSVRKIQLNKKNLLLESFIDITDNKRMQQELIKSERLEALGVLAGGIAHDFNNILTAIVGNISIVKENLLKIDPKLYERLEKAEWAIERAQRLAKQLLTFSTGGAPVLMNESIGDILKETLSFLLAGTNIKLNLNIQEELPLLEIDKDQINQVIQNLTLNAIDAIGHGGILQVSATKVKSSEEKQYILKNGDYIKITFRDNGPGIPIELKDRIFDPFFTTKQNGTGLGLSIAYSIIKKHGGYIFVENHPEGGAIFYLFLPFKENSRPLERNIYNNNTNSVSGNIVKNKMRILLMDDEEIVCDVVKEMINFLGHECYVVRNGEEAIEAYKRGMENNEKFDILIMDLTIPGGMGGKEAIKRLKEIDPYVKAIVSSGHDIEGAATSYKEHGFVASLSKPFKLQEINETLKMVASLISKE